MDTNTNSIVFDMDTDIMKQHMLAYSTDSSRHSIYKTICFESDGEKVHIFSTNGRVLFHTSIPVNGLPKFRKAFVVDTKIPSRSFNRITCVVGDTCLTVHDTQGNAYMFPENDSQFPNCFEVEPVDIEPAKIYKPLDPRFLTLVYKYIGENAFWNPMDGLACDEHSPRVWRAGGGDGVELKAVVMPYRRK